MFRLTKDFSFAYGHKVWSQDVNADYAGSSSCPCRRIHGHSGIITVEFESDTLDHRGFIIDFKELNFLKVFIDSTIDHRFIISEQDPGFERLVGQSLDSLVPILKEKHLFKDKVSMGHMIQNTNDDHLDSFFVVDFNPTSENLSKWIYDGLVDLIEQSHFECCVNSVTWSETPKTGATYSE